MQEVLTEMPQPEDVLTWTQIIYYGAGALVALCVAYLKLRQIRRKKNNAE